MAKFEAIKDRRRVFIKDEDGYDIELKGNVDFEKAKLVADYLNNNIKSISPDPEPIPPMIG